MVRACGVWYVVYGVWCVCICVTPQYEEELVREDVLADDEVLVELAVVQHGREVYRRTYISQQR